MTRKRGRVNRPFKSEQIRTNLTVEQYNNLYGLAEAAGMTVAAYVRRLIDKEIAAAKTTHTTREG